MMKMAMMMTMMMKIVATTKMTLTKTNFLKPQASRL